MSSKQKRAVFGPAAPGAPTKTPVITPGDGFNQMHACWRIQKLQLADPYGWHELTTPEWLEIRTKLIQFEGKTWNEIFVRERKHNHAIDVASLDCPHAREWMRRNLPDQDQLWTLRLTGTERIWGIFREGVFHLIFWDPHHQIKLSRV